MAAFAENYTMWKQGYDKYDENTKAEIVTEFNKIQDGLGDALKEEDSYAFRMKMTDMLPAHKTAFFNEMQKYCE